MAGIDPWSYAKITEHSHQAALFMWSNMTYKYGLQIGNDIKAYTEAGYAKAKSIELGGEAYAVPQLKWLHAIHNQGHGDAVRGAKAKAEGVKPGVFDLFLPVPTPNPNYYSGLYLELKVDLNNPSAIQNEFGQDMLAAGYQAKVAWGWLEARQIILGYLGISS